MDSEIKIEEIVHSSNSIEDLNLLNQIVISRIQELEIDKASYKQKRAVTDKKYYMEKALLNNLNFLLSREKKNWDNLLIIDGDERAGKSTIGRQIGYYITYMRNKNNLKAIEDFYNCKNIFFDPEDVLEYAKNTRNKVIIWDEAALGALSEDRFNEVQQILIKLLMVCGKYGHFLVFIIPKMKRLAPYFVEDRAIGLIRVTTIGNLFRGNFSGYGKKRMGMLYDAEKFKKGKKPYPAFRGKFKNYEGTDRECVDIAKYEERKDMAIANLDFKSKKRDKSMYYLSMLVNLIKKQKWLKKKEIASYLEVSNSYISNLPEVVDKELGKVFK